MKTNFVLPQDLEKGCIHVCIEPIGAYRDIPLVDGKPDVSMLRNTKYGKYIIGVNYDEGRDTYIVALNEEGQAIWNEEIAYIGKWMAEWGCD